MSVVHVNKYRAQLKTIFLLILILFILCKSYGEIIPSAQTKMPTALKFSTEMPESDFEKSSKQYIFFLINLDFFLKILFKIFSF